MLEDVKPTNAELSKPALTEEQTRAQKKLLEDRIGIMETFTSGYKYIMENTGIPAKERKNATVQYQRYNSMFADYFDSVEKGDAGIKPTEKQQAQIDEFKKQYNSEVVGKTTQAETKADDKLAMKEMGKFTTSKNNSTQRLKEMASIANTLAASCTQVGDIAKSAREFVQQDIRKMEEELKVTDPKDKRFVSDANREATGNILNALKEKDKLFEGFENSEQKVSNLEQNDAQKLYEALESQSARFKALSTITSGEEKTYYEKASATLSTNRDIMPTKDSKINFEAAASHLYGKNSKAFLKESEALGKIENPIEASQKMKELIGLSAQDLGTSAAVTKTKAKYDLNTHIDEKFPVYSDKKGQFYSGVFTGAGMMNDKAKISKWQTKIREIANQTQLQAAEPTARPVAGQLNLTALREANESKIHTAITSPSVQTQAGIAPTSKPSPAEPVAPVKSEAEKRAIGVLNKTIDRMNKENDAVRRVNEGMKQAKAEEQPKGLFARATERIKSFFNKPKSDLKISSPIPNKALQEAEKKPVKEQARQGDRKKAGKTQQQSGTKSTGQATKSNHLEQALKKAEKRSIQEQERQSGSKKTDKTQQPRKQSSTSISAPQNEFERAMQNVKRESDKEKQTPYGGQSKRSSKNPHLVQQVAKSNPDAVKIFAAAMNANTLGAKPKSSASIPSRSQTSKGRF